MLAYICILFWLLKQGEKSIEQAGKEDLKSYPDTDVQLDLFEENFKELRKWVDLKNSKYGTILVSRERRKGRLGTALKVLLLCSLQLIWYVMHRGSKCIMSWLVLGSGWFPNGSNFQLYFVNHALVICQMV